MTMELLIVGLLVVIAVLVFVLMRAGSRPSGESDRLGSVVGELQTMMASKDGALDVQLSVLESRVSALHEVVSSRQAVLDEQVRGIDAHVRGIAGLFSNDRARGGWGEISMLRIFELAGMVEGRDYTAQFQAGDRTPDAVVHLPGGRNIVIDAKFPVARYNEALSMDDPDARSRLLVEQARELERVGKTLVEKGYAELTSGGYVVMYLPSQAVYESAAEAHPEVVERLLEKRVMLAGPNTLFALILSVSALMTEHRAIQQADRTLDEVRELHRRMGVFVGHLRSVGSALGATVDAFNKVVGSWTSRVAPQLTRVSELNGQEELAPPDPIDEMVRELSLAG